MYYAMVKKNGEFGKWYKINVDNLDKAKDFVTTLISVKGSKKTVDNYIFKTDYEYDEMVLKDRKEAEDKLEESLRLDPVAINVLEKILERDYLDIDVEFIDEYGLKEGTHKPYYVKCYCSNGGNGSFCDLVEVEQMFYEKATSRNYDYGLEVYDAKTCDQLDVDVYVSVKINRK